MNSKSLQKAVILAREGGTVLVATADHGGLPHITAVGPPSLVSEKKEMIFEAWFCPRMIANLEANRWMALVVWDTAKKEGYQVFGRVEEVEDVLLMNGHSPEIEAVSAPPQAKKRLTLRADKIIAFGREAHTDESL
jgi:hypothetical protein